MDIGRPVKYATVRPAPTLSRPMYTKRQKGCVWAAGHDQMLICNNKIKI